MKVIILAAGIGTRLQEVWQEKPKPLFEIKGKSLIEYSLEALSKEGIKEISIVLGYKGNLIKEKIGQNFKGSKIDYIENEIYEKTGSMHSLFSALKEPEGCLVLDGDIVYDNKVISELINHKEKNVVILSNLSKSGDEVYVTLNEDNQVIFLGKNYPNEKKVYGFVGISKFSKEFIGKMMELHKNNLENKKFEEYYEDCAHRTSKFISWYGVVKENLLWSEIDKKEDIERAKRVLENLEN